MKLVIDRDPNYTGGENDSVILSVRPESVRISKEQPQTMENVSRGKVVDVTFLGTSIRHYIQANGLELIVDVQGSEEALQGDVYVTFDRSKAHLVAE